MENKECMYCRNKAIEKFEGEYVCLECYDRLEKDRIINEDS